VAALGHQQRQLHVGLGQERRMPELMQRPARLGDEQLRGAAVDSRARPVGGQRSLAAGARPGLGRRLERNTGPVVRPAIRRGSSRALPEPKNSQSVSPPLERLRARLPAMSRSLTPGAGSRRRAPRAHTAAATTCARAARCRGAPTAGVGAQSALCRGASVVTARPWWSSYAATLMNVAVTSEGSGMASPASRSPSM
jgi:hypothetical protein